MPLLQDEQILPPDHPLQKIITIMNNEFPVSGRDEKVRVGFYPILTLQYSSHHFIPGFLSKSVAVFLK